MPWCVSVLKRCGAARGRRARAEENVPCGGTGTTSQRPCQAECRCHAVEKKSAPEARPTAMPQPPAYAAAMMEARKSGSR